MSSLGAGMKRHGKTKEELQPSSNSYMHMT